ncbi:MAG: LysR family transcriptional regulator [Eubacteriales bacterium]|nr:LysR family transcriptional regulator [Eubacteriales bacterium]
MELKQLSYFVTVAEEGTISSAARKLNLTQPPLSAQMKLLEQECGCLLFERGSRRIHLTEAGRMLYNRAVAMLEFADLTRQEIRDYREGTSGTLRLGVVSSVSSTLLTHIVCGFHEKHPRIAFELIEANTYQLLEQLQSNLLQLAIVRTPFLAQGLESFCLLDEPMLAVGHQRYFLQQAAGRTALPLSSLGQTPLILYRRWEDILQNRLKESGIVPFVFCRNDDARTCALWADAGLGVAVLPASAAALVRNPETAIYQIDDRQLHSGICVVHNRDTRLSAIAKSFLIYLRSSFNSNNEPIS